MRSILFLTLLAISPLAPAAVTGWQEALGVGMATTDWGPEGQESEYSRNAVYGRLSYAGDNFGSRGFHERYRLRGRLELGTSDNQQASEYRAGTVAAAWGYGTDGAGLFGELGSTAYQFSGADTSSRRLSYIGVGFYDNRDRWHAFGLIPIPIPMRIDQSVVQLRYFRDEDTDNRLLGIGMEWGKRIGTRNLLNLDLEYVTAANSETSAAGADDLYTVGLSLNRFF